jgi:hypothetical protein
VHAAIDFCMQFLNEAQNWHTLSNYVVCLSVKNEQELLLLAKRLSDNNVKHVVFREPDLDGQATSISIEPCDKARKLCSNLPLQFKEQKEEQPLRFIDRVMSSFGKKINKKQNEQI